MVNLKLRYGGKAPVFTVEEHSLLQENMVHFEQLPVLDPCLGANKIDDLHINIKASAQLARVYEAMY
ncbi:hypothetical protein VTP01DRAFT_2602 [Rhizomucor pusillus]|uniref:uncharacterized protein n=1 Tax=Rhizomucor pusillus TaxID=4840 RepID=UPI0037438E5E